MAEYTPTDEQVRHAYVDHRDFAAQTSGAMPGATDREAGAEFDRWLSDHDARVRAEAAQKDLAYAWDDGFESGLMNEDCSSWPNPYRKEDQ